MITSERARRVYALRPRKKACGGGLLPVARGALEHDGPAVLLLRVEVKLDPVSGQPKR